MSKYVSLENLQRYNQKIKDYIISINPQLKDVFKLDGIEDSTTFFENISVVDNISKLINEDELTQKKILAFVKNDGIYYYNQKTNNKIKISDISNSSTLISNWSDLEEKPFDTLSSDDFEISEEGILKIKQSVLNQINTNKQNTSDNANKIDNLFKIDGILDEVKANMTSTVTSNTSPFNIYSKSTTSLQNSGVKKQFYELFNSNQNDYGVPYAQDIIYINLGKLTNVSKIRIKLKVGTYDDANSMTISSTTYDNGSNFTTIQKITGISQTEATWYDIPVNKDCYIISFAGYTLLGTYQMQIYNIEIFGNVEKTKLRNIRLVDSLDKLVNTDTTTQSEILAVVKGKGIYYYNQQNNEQIKILDNADISNLVTNWTELKEKPFDTLSSDDFEISEEGILNIKESILTQINNNTENIGTINTSLEEINGSIETINTSLEEINDIIDSKFKIDGVHDTEDGILISNMTSNTTPDPYKIEFLNGSFNGNSTENLYKLLTDVESFGANVTSGSTILIDLGKNETITKLRIRAAYTRSGSGNTITVEGSSNNVDFTTIGVINGLAYPPAWFDVVNQDQTIKYRYLRITVTGWNNWDVNLCNIIIIGKIKFTLPINNIRLVDSFDKLTNDDVSTQGEILAFVKDDGIYYYNQKTNNKFKVLDLNIGGEGGSTLISNWAELKEKPFESLSEDDFEISEEGILNIKESILTQINNNTEDIETINTSIENIYNKNETKQQIQELFSIDGFDIFETTSVPYYMEMTSNTAPEPYCVEMITGNSNEGVGGRPYLYQLLGQNPEGGGNITISSNSTIKITTGGLNLDKIVFSGYFGTSGIYHKTISVSSDDITYKDITIDNSDSTTHVNDTGITDVRYIKMYFDGNFYISDITLYEFPKIVLDNKLMLVDSLDKLVNNNTDTQKQTLAFVKDDGIYYYNQKTNTAIKIINILTDINDINIGWDTILEKPFESLSEDDFEISEEGILGIKESILTQINNNTEDIETINASLEGVNSSIETNTNNINDLKNNVYTKIEIDKIKNEQVQFIHTYAGESSEIEDFTPAFTSLTTPEPYKLIITKMNVYNNSGNVWDWFNRTTDTTVNTSLYHSDYGSIQFTIDLGTPQPFYGIDIKIGNGGNKASFLISGSNDNSQFTPLITQNNVTVDGNPSKPTAKRFTCAEVSKYRYIKFEISDSNGWWQLYSLRLLRTKVLPEYTDNVKIILAQSVDELTESYNYSNTKVLAFVPEDGVYAYDGGLGTRIKILDINLQLSDENFEILMNNILGGI